MTLAASGFHQLERDILHWVTCRLHQPWLGRLLETATIWQVGVGLFALGAGITALRSPPRAVRATLSAGVGAGLALAIATGLWYLVDRPRPTWEYAEVLRTPEELEGCASRPDAFALRSYAAKSPSFPSHHAVGAGALAMALWLAWRPVGAIAWLFALLVGWARLWLGRHWPTDVLAGLVLGGLATWAAWRLLPRLLRPFGVSRWVEDPSPASLGGRG